jgi:hypothetical protein
MRIVCAIHPQFFQFTYHFLSEAGRSDAAGAEQGKANNALERPISPKSRAVLEQRFEGCRTERAAEPILKVRPRKSGRTMDDQSKHTLQ